MSNEETKHAINNSGQKIYAVVVEQKQAEGRLVVVISSTGRTPDEALLYAGATKETPLVGIVRLEVAEFIPIQSVTGAWSWV